MGLKVTGGEKMRLKVTGGETKSEHMHEGMRYRCLVPSVYVSVVDSVCVSVRVCECQCQCVSV